MLYYFGLKLERYGRDLAFDLIDIVENQFTFANSKVAHKDNLVKIVIFLIFHIYLID